MKSLVAGFVFWLIATFSPDAVRQSIRLQFDKLKELVDNANGQIEKIEGTMQKSLEPLGLKIKFNELPAGFVPTFDDIQNLQSIARQPAIFCSKEFQEAIEPLNAIPPARLILELFNIPTDSQTLKDECKELTGSSIEKTMEQSLMPEITVNPESPLKMPELPQMPKMPEVPEVPELKVPKVPELKVPKISTALTKKGGKRTKKRQYTRRASSRPVV